MIYDLRDKKDLVRGVLNIGKDNVVHVEVDDNTFQTYMRVCIANGIETDQSNIMPKVYVVEAVKFDCTVVVAVYRDRDKADKLKKDFEAYELLRPYLYEKEKYLAWKETCPLPANSIDQCFDWIELHITEMNVI
jgi:hypothetical protein